MRNAVIVAPHMHNFNDAMIRARKADAIIQIETIDELEQIVENLLTNTSLLEAKCSLAYNWAQNETQVLDGIIEKIRTFL